MSDSIWYEASFGTITPVKVSKTTDKTVTVTSGMMKSVRRKESDNSAYFPTWEDAHNFLMNQADIGVISARERLHLANAYYGNIKGLKRPRETS